MTHDFGFETRNTKAAHHGGLVQFERKTQMLNPSNTRISPTCQRYQLRCDHCQRVVEIPTGGAGECTSCGTRLEIDWQAVIRQAAKSATA